MTFCKLSFLYLFCYSYIWVLRNTPSLNFLENHFFYLQLLDFLKHRDRETDRQTDRRKARQTDQQSDRQIDRQKDRQTDRQTDRQADRKTYRQTDRQTGVMKYLYCPNTLYSQYKIF